MFLPLLEFVAENGKRATSESMGNLAFLLDGLHYTILIIAHRLSTIKNADRVVVLKQERIDQIGSYEELIAQSVSFRRMVELQEL